VKNLKAKIAAGATVVLLGGLGGLALSQGEKTPSKPVADKPLVRTKVIRRTVHVTKHAKPKHPPAAAPVEPVAAAPVATGSSGTGEPVPVSTGSSGTGAEAAPVTTGSSGGGGGGGEEVEQESEGGGDD
jgi:hypothetical protein